MGDRKRIGVSRDQEGKALGMSMSAVSRKRSGPTVRIFSMIILSASATACASVEVSMPGFGSDRTASVAPHSERVALNNAADALADQPWGEEAQSGVISVLFGTVAENDQERLVEEYLEAVRVRSADPVDGIMSDAEISLFQARRVVEAGRHAVDAVTPASSDIATLEDAIGEARECRRVYARALDSLANDKTSGAADEAEAVRKAFSDVIEDLSDAADRVAAKVADAQGRDRYAQPLLGVEAR